MCSHWLVQIFQWSETELLVLDCVSPTCLPAAPRPGAHSQAQKPHPLWPWVFQTLLKFGVSQPWVFPGPTASSLLPGWRPCGRVAVPGTALWGGRLNGRIETGAAWRAGEPEQAGPHPVPYQALRNLRVSWQLTATVHLGCGHTWEGSRHQLDTAAGDCPCHPRFEPTLAKSCGASPSAPALRAPGEGVLLGGTSWSHVTGTVLQSQRASRKSPTPTQHHQVAVPSTPTLCCCWWNLTPGWKHGKKS